MPDLGDAARAWLSPGPESPWRFDERGDVLVWRDGATIAFRSEIEDVLRRVATEAGVVPPFAAVVLLCAAARSEGRRLPDERWDMVRESLEAATPWLFARVAAVKEVAETADMLRVLTAIPDGFFARSDALATLAEAVVRGSGLPRNAADAQRFVEDLDARPTPGTAPGDGLSAGWRAVAWGEALAALRRGLARFDPAAMERRARTGVETDLRPAPVELPDSDAIRALLGVLAQDPKLGALARLAVDAGAAVRLPRLPRAAGELPVGGVSDLENRGSPERLLVSELAHDGLTLAVRVALGQALYLRCEPPPRARRSTRCVLLDSGIRLWGVARIFATAVGLALGATAASAGGPGGASGACRGTGVRVFRAAVPGIEPVDFGTREGIDRHLAALSAATSPVAALPAFLGECAGLGDDTECCIVTHAGALGEREFRDALRAAGRPLHVVAVDAAGGLTVHTFGAAGGAVVRRATLDLAAVLEAPVPAADGTPRFGARESAPGDADLPQILRLPTLPLRVQHDFRSAEFCEAEGHGVAAVSPDRRLVLWTDASMGPVELSPALPRGRFVGLASPEQGVVQAVCGGGAGIPVRLVHADLVEGWTETHELLADGSAPHAAILLRDVVGLVVSRSRVLVVTVPASGAAEMLATEGLPFAGGRFFGRAGARRWLALARAGGGARLEPVPIAGDLVRRVVTVFDRRGRDGPWAVLRDPSQVVCLATGEIRPMPAGEIADPPVPTAISTDGCRLVFPGTRGAHSWQCVDLGSAAPDSRPVAGPGRRWVEPVVARENPPSLRRRFGSVTAAADGRILLHGAPVRMTRDGRSLELGVPAVTPGLGLSARSRAFVPRPLPGHRWSLRVARWDDGSRAFLDSRGMLHLVSADATLPEITLVLTDGPLTAWCSDGRTHGSAYHLGEPGNATATEIADRLRMFVERTL